MDDRPSMVAAENDTEPIFVYVEDPRTIPSFQNLPLELREQIYHYLLKSEILDIELRLGTINAAHSDSLWRRRASVLWEDNPTSNGGEEDLIAEQNARNPGESPTFTIMQKLGQFGNQYPKEAAIYHWHLYQVGKVNLRLTIRGQHERILHKLSQFVPKDKRAFVMHIRLSRFSFEILAGHSPLTTRGQNCKSRPKSEFLNLEVKAIRELYAIEKHVLHDYPNLKSLDLGCDLLEFHPSGGIISEILAGKQSGARSRLPEDCLQILGLHGPEEMAHTILSFATSARGRKIELHIAWQDFIQQYRHSKSGTPIVAMDAVLHQRAANRFIADLKRLVALPNLSASFENEAYWDVTRRESMNSGHATTNPSKVTHIVNDLISKIQQGLQFG